MSDGTQIRPGDIDSTVRRALLEPMFVVEDHPSSWGDHQVVVYNEDREYVVNVDVEHCTCPAMQYHCGADEVCKHVIRAQLALGEREIPAWVNLDAVDDQLLRQLEGQR